MADKTITVKARGLFLNPNDLGDVPDGALLEAKNVVIGRDGIIEARPGTQLVNNAFSPVRVAPYKSGLVGIDATGNLAYSGNQGVTWTVLSVSPESMPTDAKVRFVEASGNVYFNTGAGARRLDSAVGVPSNAGVPPAMDAKAVISSPTPVDRDGTAVAPDSQTGYRLLFAKRDANLNLLLGAPSQRAVVVNPSITVPAGGVSIDGSHVVTVTFSNHGFTTGQKVQCYSSELDLTNGSVVAPAGGGPLVVTPTSGLPVLTSGVVGPIVVTSANSFTYTDANAKISYVTKEAATYASGYRDVLVSATIPPGIDSSYFFQGYKTLSSATSDVDPGDEMGLIYEGPIPPVTFIHFVQRVENVVFCTTDSPHSLVPGVSINFSPGVTGGTGSTVVAAGSSIAAVSTDGGHTWSNIGQGMNSNGPMENADGRYVMPGTDYIAYSTTGTTWNSVAVKDGTNVTIHRQVAYGLNYWASVCSAGAGGYFIYTSADHCASWSKATITDTTGGTSYAFRGIAFGAGVFCVVGTGYYGGVPWFITVTSTNGTTWTLNKINVIPDLARAPGYLAYGGGNLGSAYFFSVYDGTVGGFTPMYWAAVPSVAQYSYGWSANYLSGKLPTSSWVPRWLNGSWWLCGGSGNGQLGQISNPPSTCTLQAPVGNPVNRDITHTGTEYVMVGQAYNAPYTSTTIYTSLNGTSWTARTCPSGIYGGVALGTQSQDIPAGVYVITEVPDAYTFKFASVGANLGVTNYSHNATPVSVGFLDTVPDTFLGAALYTSPSQETILQSNDVPPACRDIARYRGYIFWAAPTPLTSAQIALISVGGTAGVQPGDTLTINGHQVIAGAVESATSSPPSFQLFTDPNRTPSQNIADTASSLMRVVNMNSGTFGCYLIDTSDRNGVPGQMTIRTTTPGVSTTFAFTSTIGKTPWSPSTASASTYTVAPVTNLNELRFSKANQPDACPELNSLKVGASDKAIVRILATRSSLFVFKEDQIFQLTGYASPFQVDPFDSTTNIVGAETAVALDNQIYLLTQNGIQRVSDTGTTLISRPIDPPLAKLISYANRSMVEKLAFGIGCNSDHKYYLWLPLSLDEGGSVGDTYAKQCYVYDYFTDCYTFRDDSYFYGVEIQDGRLLWCAPGGTKVELRSKTSNDLRDDYCTIVGATSAGSAIQTSVRWAPKFGQDPAALNHFKEAGFLFRDAYFPNTATVDFSTVPGGGEDSWWSVPLDPAAYGMTTSGVKQFAVRVLVPPECRRAGLLNVRIVVPVYMAPYQIQALSMSYNVGPTRFGR